MLMDECNQGCMQADRPAGKQTEGERLVAARMRDKCHAGYASLSTGFTVALSSELERTCAHFQLSLCMLSLGQCTLSVQHVHTCT